MKVEPTVSGPNEGGLDGQDGALVTGETRQTRPATGDGVTDTVIWTKCERLPLLPVTVRTKLVPEEMLELTLIVMFETPDLPEATTIGFGTYLTRTVEGNILLLSVTVPLKLLTLVAMRMSDTDPPDLTESIVEDADRVKSGGSVPLDETVAPWIFSDRVVAVVSVTRTHVLVPLTLLGVQPGVVG